MNACARMPTDLSLIWWAWRRASALAGWQLLAVLVGALVPSASLLPYLSAYIYQRGPEGYASFCLRTLRRGAFALIRRTRCASAVCSPSLPTLHAVADHPRLHLCPSSLSMCI
jgi:hypothetical protein